MIYKKVPGNDKFEISLTGEVRNSDGSECTLPITNNLVQIYLYGKEYNVCPIWLGLIAHFEVNHKNIFNVILNNAIFKDTNPRLTKSLSKKVMVFTKPIYVKPGFRMIPCFPMYAIDASGVVINIDNFDVIKPLANQYPKVNVYNPDRNKFMEVMIHRLVALAWVKNNDYVENYTVNHKDGNKLNYHYLNLEWTSLSRNIKHAFETGLRNDNIRCKIRDATNGEVKNFSSVGDACLFMGINKRIKDLEYRRKHKLINGKFEIKLEDDLSPWYYENISGPVKEGRYVTKITYPNGMSESFFDLRDVIRKFQLWNMPSMSAIEIINRMGTQHPSIKIEITDSYYRPIQGRNILTNEVISANSSSEMSKIIGIDRRKINAGLIHDGKRNIEGWVFRDKTDDEWSNNITSYDSGVVCIHATNQITKENKTFKSLRDASTYFKTSRQTLQRCLKKNNPYGDWELKKHV